MKSHERTLFWLLAAATVAVDGVAIVRLAEEGPLSRIVYLYDALVSAQVAVVCIWAKYTNRPGWLRLVGIVPAVSVGALLGWHFAKLELAESFGIYSSFAAALILALWLLDGMRWWQRVTRLGSATWQFSVGQMLGTMTLVALLITALRASELLFGPVAIWKVLLVMTLTDVLTVATTIGIWSQKWHWFLRLMAAIAMATAIGTAQTIAASLGLFGSSVTGSIENDLVPDIAYRIIMTLVIFVWLELGPIIPASRRADVTPPAGNAN